MNEINTSIAEACMHLEPVGPAKLEHLGESRQALKTPYRCIASETSPFVE